MGACSARPLLLEDWDTTRDKSLPSCQKLRTLGPELEVPRAPTVWSVFLNPQTLGPPPVCPVQRQGSHDWDRSLLDPGLGFRVCGEDSGLPVCS